MENKDNYLITASNDLINARYSLGVVETRLFLLALSQIQPTDEELKTYKIYINDFLQSAGIKTKSYHGEQINDMKPITKSLMSKVIEITQKDGRPWQFNLISTARYSKDEKGAFVEMGFNTYIKADLIRLKEKFLSLDLRNILPCKSIYTIRLYQLLKQYLFRGERIEKVLNLKYMFEIENEYQNYFNFKKKVILKAQEEMKEKTDIYFEFEEIKTGRSITDIKFKIYRQKPKRTEETEQPEQQTQEPTPPPVEPQNPLIKRLVSLGFNEKQAAEIVARETPEYITANADILEEKQKKGEIKNNNIPAFSRGFSTDFRKQKTTFELEQEKKQEDEKKAKEQLEKAKREREQAEFLGEKVYNQALLSFSKHFFENRDKNRQLIENFENQYIKNNVGAMLYKKNPETAKQAFLSHRVEKEELRLELIKFASLNGYVLTFNENTEKWQAIKDTQERLF